jgi:tetratricopeptide (TPR) repeat protein
VPVLQQLSVELSAQIKAARAEGRADEAKTLTEGFTKLLDKLSAEPNLSAGVQLFIGQSLTGVGEHARAIEALRKVPDPGLPILTKPANAQTPEEHRAVTLYRAAVLYLVRALRGAKQYKEADELLTKAIGTTEKPGWGSNSLDYRKEVAYLFEAKGADEPDPKLATKLWGQGQQQWNGLFSVARKRLADAQNQLAKETADPPPPGAARMTGAQVVTLKNAYYEAFFDVNRCVVKANTQILKGNPKLQGSLTSAATKFVDIEKLGGAEISAEVHNKYADLLNEVPELKKALAA